MIRFNCPHCQRRIRVDDANAHAVGRCPFCRQKIQAPATSPSEKIPAIEDKGVSGRQSVVWPLAVVFLILVAALAAWLEHRDSRSVATSNTTNDDPQHTSVYLDKFGLPQWADSTEKGAPQTESGATKAESDARDQATPRADGVAAETIQKLRVDHSTKLRKKLSPVDLYKRASPAVVKVTAHSDEGQTSTGSGFFITPEGALVTNYHVVDDADTVSVQLADERTFEVRGFIAYSVPADLIILKVDATDLPTLRLNTATPPVGSPCYAIGSPMGLEGSLSDGMISGVRHIGHAAQWYQLTAPISPGSSGGPLLREDGSVIAITTFQVREGQNLNFAIAAGSVVALLNEQDNHTVRPLSRHPHYWLRRAEALTSHPALLERQAFFLYQIGLLEARLGDTGRAADLCRQQVLSTDELGYAWNNDYYAKMSIGMAKRGLFDEAKRFALAIPEDRRLRHNVIEFLAMAHAQLGQFQEAEAIAQHASFGRELIQRKLLTTTARRGDLDAVNDLLEHMDLDVGGYAGLTHCLIEAGKKRAASELIASRSFSVDDQAYIRLVQARGRISKRNTDFDLALVEAAEPYIHSQQSPFLYRDFPVGHWPANTAGQWLGFYHRPPHTATASL